MYTVMTKDGWKPLLPPMAPTAPLESWWVGALTGLRIDHSSRDSTWAAYHADIEAIKHPPKSLGYTVINLGGVGV